MSTPSFNKPQCGPQAQTVDDAVTTVLTLLGFISTLAGGIIGVIKLGNTAFEEGVIFGVSGVNGFVLVAAAGAALIIGIVAIFLKLRCEKREGPFGCAAGVVNHIRESFSSVREWVFPFTAMHDQVDVTVKRQYWELVRENSEFVACAGDRGGSPVLQCFYYSEEVCNVIGGALVGAMIAGTVAVWLTPIFGPLLIAACATLLLCILAIIIVFLAAVLITLIGAAVGGWIAKATVEEDQPMSGGQAVLVGHYITASGTLVRHREFEGAIVMWFVESSMLHGGPSRRGEGPGGGPPYPESDPFQNLPDDGCAPLSPP
jgi:hypothetical protein